MKWYAEYGVRRVWQVLADAVMAAWCALWIALGTTVASSFDGARDGARKLQDSGGSLSQHMSDAGHAVADIPMVGGGLKEPFDQAASAASAMGTAGHDLADGLGQLALLLGFLTATAPMFFALLPWALVRLRYARRAGRLARLRRMPGAEKLLALEALTSASPRVLARISPDPAGDWQAGAPSVTRELAATALAERGLRLAQEPRGV